MVGTRTPNGARRERSRQGQQQSMSNDQVKGVLLDVRQASRRHRRGTGHSAVPASRRRKAVGARDRAASARARHASGLSSRTTRSKNSSGSSGSCGHTLPGPTGRHLRVQLSMRDVMKILTYGSQARRHARQRSRCCATSPSSSAQAGVAVSDRRAARNGVALTTAIFGRLPTTAG